MEGFIAMFVVVAGMSVIGILANAFGVDSRPVDLDDWSRGAAH